MKEQDIVERFGGTDEVKAVTKTKAIDDVYCWELGKWFSDRYWNEKMKDTHTGVTLRELAIAAKV